MCLGLRLRRAACGARARVAAPGDCHCGMDIDDWLGAVVRVGQRDKALPDRVKDALKKAWEEDVLEEDDVPDGYCCAP